MAEKKPQAERATVEMVEKFYDLLDEANQEKNLIRSHNKRRFAILTLGLRNPPSWDEFRAMLDEDIEKLCDEIRAKNPAHFPGYKPEGEDEKKSAESSATASA